MTNADQNRLHHYPYVPRLFYFIPIQWLRDLTTTGDIDTRHLLLAMNQDGADHVSFPPDQREETWIRSVDPQRPSVVSHTTYYKYLNALMEQGWLRRDKIARDDVQIYQLLEWPTFADFGVIYAPRAYILKRWPAWLKKNEWGSRAALTGLFASMSERMCAPGGISVSGPPGQPLVIATAYREQLKTLVSQLLCAAKVAHRVGEGLQMLADLGVIEEEQALRSKGNRAYRFRSDAFDHPESQWSLSEIARQCSLNAEQDLPWIELIQAFLRYNYQPATASLAVWQEIRAYARDVSSPEDARRVLAMLDSRASRPDSARRGTGVRRILGEYVAQQAREKRWLLGPEFELPLAPGACTASRHWLPIASLSHVQATQLVVQATPTGRLSKADACALLAGARFYVRQRVDPYLERLIALVPPPAWPDPAFVFSETVLDGLHLHRLLDDTRPFQIMLESPQPGPQLSLRGYFRVRLPKRVPPVNA